MRRGALEKEQRHVESLLLRRQPVGRVLARYTDLDRRDALPADESIEVQQPFFAEQADIEVDAIESPQRPDRVGSILENMRRPHGLRGLEKQRQRSFFDEVVELTVVQAARGQRLLAPTLG